MAMASFTYNIGSKSLADRTLDYAAGVIEVILMKSTYTANKDDTYTVYAAGEISGVAGYTGAYGGAGRKVLATKTITNDTANDRTVYDAADPSAWTLGTGDTIGGAIVGLKGAAADATAIPLFWCDITDLPTNGSTFTLIFDALGIGYTQQ
jgi:hypothetical protein